MRAAAACCPLSIPAADPATAPAARGWERHQAASSQVAALGSLLRALARRLPPLLIHHARCSGCCGSCLVAALHRAHLTQHCLLQGCAASTVHSVHLNCHAQGNLKRREEEAGMREEFSSRARKGAN